MFHIQSIQILFQIAIYLPIKNLLHGTAIRISLGPHWYNNIYNKSFLGSNFARNFKGQLHGNEMISPCSCHKPRNVQYRIVDIKTLEQNLEERLTSIFISWPSIRRSDKILIFDINEMLRRSDSLDICHFDAFLYSQVFCTYKILQPQANDISTSN